MFPHKIKYKDELIVLFKNHYEAVFRLMTCVDLYMFTIRLSRLLKQTNGVGNKCINLVDKINKLSEQYIATEFNKLISDNKYSSVILEQNYPIMDIIKKCFVEYIDGAAFKNIGTVTDIFCYQNEMKYSLDKYELFPPIMKYSKYRSNGKLVDIKPIDERRKKVREAYEKMKIQNLEMVNYIALRHSQKIPA
jgi:hypothetical protein